MESCPFCSAAVDEELILYGGNCPSCLNEIPGEEAPTNPGEQARANAEMEAEASRRSTRIVPLIGAAVAVLLVGGIWYQQTRNVPAPPMELPEIVIDNDLSGHVNPDDPFAEDPEEAVASNSGGSGGSSGSGGSGGTGSTSATTRVEATPTGGQISANNSGSSGSPTHGSVGPSAPSGPSGGVNSFDPGVSIDPLSGVANASSRILTSESEINAMVAQALGTYTSRLQRCYNTRLNEAPNLKGTWNISFTVTRTGSVSRVNVAALDTTDSTLETCLAQAVSRFSFQKIAQEKPVSFPVRFGT